MEQHIKLFSTDSARTTFESSQNYQEPYISKVAADNSVHYNKPFVETRVVAKFNVISTSNPTQIMNSVSGRYCFNKIWIDDVEQQNLVYQYTFSTLGEHEVKYELIDSTTLGDNDVESYGSFGECHQLTSVVIPDSVTTIKMYVFQLCTSLTNVTFGSGLTEIEDDAFYGCSSLTSIVIPKTVTSIGWYGNGGAIFSSCNNLTSIVVEEGNTVFDSRNNCNAIIHTASNKLCSGCKNTIIPNTVTSIGDCAFHNIGLTSITIPNSVTSIEQRAFLGSGLTTIIIGTGVTSIGMDAFDSCSSLESITCLRSTAPSISNTTFRNVKTGGTLFVPSGANYNTWMGTGNYYLGKYNWTKVTNNN